MKKFRRIAALIAIVLLLSMYLVSLIASLSGSPQAQTLFRFSKHFGIVDADDVSGTPYYIGIQNLTQLPATDEEMAAKKHKAVNGLYYNVPGKLRSTIFCGNDVISKEDFPAAQFGNVELLTGDLFNKHYGTRLWLNPLTGGIDKLEAEQPK